MRKLIFLIIFALVFAQPLMASDQGDVKDLVERNIKIVMGFIKNKSLDKETRNRKIIDSMAPFFDFNFMAKVCLGKKYWKPLSKTKRKEFTELFVKRLKESYIEKFDLYTDEEVEVEAAKKVKKRIHVVTYLVSKGDRMEMIFKFRKTKKGWKVYDLEILGVSIVLPYRSQFSGFLKKNSMDDLLEKLAVTGSFATSGSKK